MVDRKEKEIFLSAETKSMPEARFHRAKKRNVFAGCVMHCGKNVFLYGRIDGWERFLLRPEKGRGIFWEVLSEVSGRTMRQGGRLR